MKTEPTLTIKAKDDGLIKIYACDGDYTNITAVKVTPDGTESPCEMNEYLQALIGCAVAAIPFSQAYTDCCGVYDKAYGVQDPNGFQEFLDQNSVTPSGTTVGDWRKLADTIITKP
ncbi:hypothetical protein OTK49_02750 [Vibrio coralliirubri]|uniref:hypothetical protein n=1 Tax=Vibrio coralliirubri TaxID=1516159 RepID=UPI002284DBB6|nr:hypothetical protein [Vibrio coralliirubri]MCY9861437.1 hypothetical protein [Vibrio coralliirubri]